jgi:quercetin dioxygenase-like cupin family protein
VTNETNDRKNKRATSKSNGEEKNPMAKEVNDVRTRQDERRYYNPVQKDAATFLKTSEETEGEYTLMEIEVAPGGGTKPHYHKTYTESFEVIEGSLEVLVGDQTCFLRAGEKAVVPRNTLHRFHNAMDETVTFLCEMRPGQPGFENTLKVGYGLASDGLTRSDGTPKNLYHMALLLEWSEIRVPGIFTLIEPIMRFLAKRARRKGIDKELEERYCR